jgi:EAL domain-containing protein (putative c-di-GMP-specific phosphodiesterase class I)
MPVVSLWEGRMVGVEVLARWRTPEGRALLPAEFLPRVDEAELWTDLDHAVVTAAVDAGRDLPGGVGFGVNLSAASLSRPDLAD